MNAREFFNLVSEMRSAQKEYFALRKEGADQTTKKEALRHSLDLERQVDNEISRVHEILKRQSINQ